MPSEYPGKKTIQKEKKKLCQHETHKRIGWERRGEEAKRDSRHANDAP
jgi:hypothetical protein